MTIEINIVCEGEQELLSHLNVIRRDIKREIRRQEGELAMKEIAELSFEAGSKRATFNGYPGIPDPPNKEEFIKQLFPEK